MFGKRCAQVCVRAKWCRDWVRNSATQPSRTSTPKLRNSYPPNFHVCIWKIEVVTVILVTNTSGEMGFYISTAPKSGCVLAHHTFKCIFNTLILFNCILYMYCMYPSHTKKCWNLLVPPESSKHPHSTCSKMAGAPPRVSRSGRGTHLSISGSPLFNGVGKNHWMQ